MKKLYICNLIVAGLICAAAIFLAWTKGYEHAVSSFLSTFYFGGSIVLFIMSFFTPKMNDKQERTVKKWLFLCFDILATASIVAILNDHLDKKTIPIIAAVTVGGIICLFYTRKTSNLEIHSPEV